MILSNLPFQMAPTSRQQVHAEMNDLGFGVSFLMLEPWLEDSVVIRDAHWLIPCLVDLLINANVDDHGTDGSVPTTSMAFG